MRWIVLITGIAVLLSVASSDITVERRHTSGVTLIPRLDISEFIRERERMGETAFEPIAFAYHDARRLAEEHPDLFGVPWHDLANRRVVVRLVKPEAVALVRRPTSVPLRFVATTRSFGQLRSIMDGSLDDPALGIRGGASRVWSIGIDDASQRVVFETDRVVDGFLFALARAYGTEAVAVRVDPRSGPFGRAPATLAPVSTVSDGSGALGIAALAAVASVLPLAALLVFWRRRRAF
jgi:hypothetical protein